MGYRARSISEVLTLSGNQARLVHHDPRKGDQVWSCNRHWARPEIHTRGGPVPNYVTLSGEGRQVEIGAFLSEEERIAAPDHRRIDFMPNKMAGIEGFEWRDHIGLPGDLLGVSLFERIETLVVPWITGHLPMLLPSMGILRSFDFCPRLADPGPRILEVF